MSEDKNELLNILDGNVGEVVAALKGKTDDELNALLSAEESGKTRIGVVNAITEMLEHEPPEPVTKRTVKAVKAELEEAEAGPTDIINARMVIRLRAELADLKGKK
jgi:hypothetical protein